MRDNDIYCPPYAPVLMESTRSIGYSIESAIADIIDNSISALAHNVSIFFATDEHPFVAIVDDGVGMSEEVLTEAMRYGSCSPTSERNENDLGRYGLGMKTASLSQCRRLSVISKQKDQLIGRRWDLDYIADTGNWSLQQLSQTELKYAPCIEMLREYSTGTLVIWEDLDKLKLGSLTLDKYMESKMNDVKQHLELVFHRFLEGDGGEQIAIFLNGVRLTPFNPFFVGKSTVIMDDERIAIPGRTGQVVIRPYILPHPSNMTQSELKKYGGKEGLRNLQGFYIYRNRRLLTWGTWFQMRKMDEFSKLTRVRVDIPNSLDDLWTLDVKKSTAYPPEIVKTRLKQLVEYMANGSKRTWTFRQRKELTKEMVHIWDKVETRDGVRYVVNKDHPLLIMIESHLNNEDKQLLSDYIDTVQNNLPFNNLHVDLNNDVKIEHDTEDTERDRVCYMAKRFLREAEHNGNGATIVEHMRSIEPFMSYMSDIEKIYAEVRHNG